MIIHDEKNEKILLNKDQKQIAAEPPVRRATLVMEGNPNANTEEITGQRAFREQLSLLEQLGCTVKHKGPMPSRSLHAQIFRDAIRTAAINAVRHANADILFVETKIDGAAFDISISDNGSVRTEHLTEGGGLSSLRKEVESADGEMKITTEKNVKIYIHLPTEK